VFSLSYPATLRRDTTGCYLSFPDVRGANTGDSDRDSTLAGAADCLAVALETYMEQQRDIPKPSKPKKGQYLIAVPLALALKIAVYQAMRDTHVTTAELARRMDVSESLVKQVLDPSRAANLETIERALAQLGRTARLTVEEQPEYTPEQTTVAP
jgi:antitoxin HicB